MLAYDCLVKQTQKGEGKNKPKLLLIKKKQLTGEEWF